MGTTLAAHEAPPVGRPGGLIRRAAQNGVRAFGSATAASRPDPDFLIIGAKRGGSTSFYFDLLDHPQVCPLFPPPNLLLKSEATKGIHYFDVNYFRGQRWYRSYLPSRRARESRSKATGLPAVTGEASPYYLFHPGAASRAGRDVPDARLIVVLRDPVQRTHSHWKERCRSGQEHLAFVDALAAEDDRVGDDEARLAADPRYYSAAHENASYARQSEYDTALGRWIAEFGRDRLLVIGAEAYFRDPGAELAQATEFLGLAAHPLGSGVVRNAAPSDRLDPGVARRLAARFAPHNESLQRLTGESFAWQ